MGDFDMLAVVVADDEDSLGSQILQIRRIDGVKRTESLRVMDYVSTSENAPDGHRVSAAD
jgi:DNA-binding Lrp family transcriptional regulator